jgi:hypothetical protein
MSDNIIIVKRLFDRYTNTNFDIKPDTQKKFNPDEVIIREGKTGSVVNVWGCKAEPPPSLRMEYNYDNVIITYYSRCTTHLGDTDTFTDYSVIVDGKTIVNKEYE